MATETETKNKVVNVPMGLDSDNEDELVSTENISTSLDDESDDESDDEIELIKLIPKEGEEYIIEMPKSHGKYCHVIQNALTDDFDGTMKMHGFPHELLQKVVEFFSKMEEFKKIEQPLESNVFSELTSEWHCKFIEEMDVDFISPLLCLSNQFCIQNLFDILAVFLACKIKGKTEKEAEEATKAYEKGQHRFKTGPLYESEGTKVVKENFDNFLVNKK